MLQCLNVFDENSWAYGIYGGPEHERIGFRYTDNEGWNMDKMGC